ncbi:MAG: ATP-binding protein [Geminicoccaceae bacterium]
MRTDIVRLSSIVACCGAVAGAGITAIFTLQPLSAYGRLFEGGAALLLSFPVIALLLAVRALAAKQIEHLENAARLGAGELPPEASAGLLDELDRVSNAWRSASDVLRGERAASLHEREDMRRELEEAEETSTGLIDFFYSASHELKGPNNTISALLGIVLEDHAMQLPRTAIEHITNSLSLLERTRTLVADIVRYITAMGTTDFVPQKIDLDEIAQSVKEECADRLGWRDATIHIGKMPEVSGVPGEVQTLFRNITDNSFKFCDKERLAFSITCECSPDYYLIHFRDNGMGIAREYLDKIFEPFTRLHTYEEFPGSGLGLTQCRCIANRHGWTLSVISEVGEGTTFTLRIPIRNSRTCSPLVMVLDDDRFDRMLVRRALEKTNPGVEVVEFSLAEEALDFVATLDSLSSLVILIDINLPRVDGFEFIDMLFERFGEKVADVQIAVVSTSLNPDYRLRAGNDPRIAYYFEKPVRSRDLEEIMSDMSTNEPENHVT